MAFKQRYKCEFCDERVWAFEAPTKCECESPMDECTIHKIPPPPYMGNFEKNARYKEQYKRNNYSWLGKEPTMYMGAFDEYPSR